MKDFFVSYAQADRAWAEWIAWQLEQNGYSVVVQAWDFRPGGNFVRQMGEAYAEAERTLAVLSPDYLASRFAVLEWTAPLSRDPTGELGLLLPVRVREVDLARHPLSPIAYIDLAGLVQEEEAVRVLLAGVARGRAAPAVAPGFPGSAGTPGAQRPSFPGALPSVWNLTVRRNPNFAGREALLSGLRNELQSTPIVALTGLGGVGKTQVAVEHAYRNAGSYDVVWWIRAETAATLADDVALLAEELNLAPEGAADHARTLRAVRRWLGGHGRWLLIFDNAASAHEVDEYLPPAGTGHVLVTSRNPDWSAVAHTLPVEVLPADEAVEFLVRRTGADDRDAAAALAEELGNLPLALEHAAAYVRRMGGVSLDDYLRLFRARQSELLGRERPPPGYHATVATTWSVSLQEVRNASPEAAALLDVCAYLAPDAIPRELLSAAAGLPPDTPASRGENELELNDRLAVLRGFSLMQPAGRDWTVHRLVQLVTRDFMPAEEQRRCAEAAVNLVYAAFPRGEIQPDSWPECARLLPHALAAAGHAEKLGVEPPQTAGLLNKAGMYLSSRAEFVQARAVFERALALVDTRPMPWLWAVSTIASNLGTTLETLNDLAGARAHLQRALEIDRALLGPEHPTVAIRLNNLGSVLQSLGELAEARAHYERALEIDRANLSADHPSLAVRLNNLGCLLLAQKDLDGARDLHEEALQICLAAHGPRSPQVALTLHNLGNVATIQKDFSAARALYEQALEIDEAAYGPAHLAVGQHLDSLGGVMFASGDPAGARRHGERALAIYTQVLGPDHPTTARMRRDLAALGS